MTGNLSVVAATLAAAPAGVLAGEPLTLSGRARGRERAARARAVGRGRRLGGARPGRDADASTAPTRAHARGRGRVLPRRDAAAGTSPVVTPDVTAKVDVRVDGAPRDAARARHAGAQGDGRDAGALLPLALPLARRQAVKLGAAARRCSCCPRARTYARVALRRRRGGPALVRSGVVKSWNGRAAQDPDTIMPPMTGMHGGHGGGEDGSGGHAGH